jgi:hypothetical protein
MGPALAFLKMLCFLFFGVYPLPVLRQISVPHPPAGAKKAGTCFFLRCLIDWLN